jgi:nicotinamide-nucleotide amidase
VSGHGEPPASALATDVGGHGEPSAPALATAEQVISELARRGLTIAVAESLTGGLLGATLTSVPGASQVFRGGVIAYAADLKVALLGVPRSLLVAQGAVHPGVALAMAQGARERLVAAVGAATTGVAGPDPADGKPPGTVYIAACTASRQLARELALTGGREDIRAATVRECLSLVWSALAEEKS